MAAKHLLTEDLLTLLRNPPETLELRAEATAEALDRYVSSRLEADTPSPEPEPGPDPEPEPPPEPEPEPPPVGEYLHPPQRFGQQMLADAVAGRFAQLGVNPGNVAEYASEIQDRGFAGVRSRIHKGTVDLGGGRYDFTRGPDYVRMAREFNQHGMCTLFMLRPSASEGRTTSGRLDFARFCAAAVERFHGLNVVFEIFNEWNISKFNSNISDDPGMDDIRRAADDCHETLKVVVPAMQAVDPNVFIIAPGLANRGGPYIGEEIGARVFMKRLVALGTFNLVQGASIHPYTGEGKAPQSPMPEEDQYPESSFLPVYRQILGPDVVIFNTEQGWKSNKSEQQNQLQAAYNVRDAVIGLFYAVRLGVVYMWSRSPSDDYFIHDKPSARAMEVFKQQLAGFDMTRRVDTGTEHQYVFEFANTAGEKRLVAWRRDPSVPNTWELPEKAEAVTLLGNQIATYEAGWPLTLSVNPIYLRL